MGYNALTEHSIRNCIARKHQQDIIEIKMRRALFGILLLLVVVNLVQEASSFRRHRVDDTEKEVSSPQLQGPGEMDVAAPAEDDAEDVHIKSVSSLHNGNTHE